MTQLNLNTADMGASITSIPSEVQHVISWKIIEEHFFEKSASPATPTTQPDGATILIQNRLSHPIGNHGSLPNMEEMIKRNVVLDIGAVFCNKSYHLMH